MDGERRPKSGLAAAAAQARKANEQKERPRPTPAVLAPLRGTQSVAVGGPPARSQAPSSNGSRAWQGGRERGDEEGSTSTRQLRGTTDPSAGLRSISDAIT